MDTKDQVIQIRHSRQEDLPAMLRIYEYARTFMADHGNYRQWGATHWPPEALLQEDIRLGRSCVCTVNGRIVGTFAYLYGPHIESNYEKIEEGSWPGEKLLHEKGNTYGVVHRLAGDGSVKGIGAAALNWAFEQCGHLRADTHPDNAVMQHLLPSLGFVRCGIIHVREDNDPRYAYEKLPAVMKQKKLTVVIPQWQGGGQDCRTWNGAFALRDQYLKDADAVTVNIGQHAISPLKENILGYDDILHSMDLVNSVLYENNPARIFTIGGGCDADTPCAAWLNSKYKGDMAVIYMDAHGDLNTPESSESKLYYGMSLRALLSDGAPGILNRLASTIRPDQLITCGGRSLDPEETRYLRENNISAFTVEQLEQDPENAAREVIRKGFHHVYIHVDFDCLDPGEFSLTPVPEPDGLRRDTLMAVIRSLQKSGTEIVGFGLLEYAGTMNDSGDLLIDSLVSVGKKL